MNDKKKTAGERFNRFLAGRGFYIALFLCVLAIGISGYYLLRSNSVIPSLDPGAFAPVTGPVDIHLDDTTQPADAVTKAEPGPDPAPVFLPEPEPEPTVKPLPAVTPAPPEVKTSYAWPVSGSILTEYSDSLPVFSQTLADWRVHAGIDIAVPGGTQVLAVTAGKVSAVYEDDLMGTTVVLSHGDGYSSVYANRAAVPAVAEGDKVQTGDVIGSVGATALAEIGDAPHLHFEVLQNGLSVNPADILPKR